MKHYINDNIILQVFLYMSHKSSAGLTSWTNRAVPRGADMRKTEKISGAESA